MKYMQIIHPHLNNANWQQHTAVAKERVSS